MHEQIALNVAICIKPYGHMQQDGLYTTHIPRCCVTRHDNLAGRSASLTMDVQQPVSNPCFTEAESNAPHTQSSAVKDVNDSPKKML